MGSLGSQPNSNHLGDIGQVVDGRTGVNQEKSHGVLLYRENDLADVLPLLHPTVGLGRFGEGEDVVHDGA